METESILNGLAQELKRGTVVLCVLDRLRQPMYGYALVSELNAHGVEVDTNTLYPLLRRLESQGLLQSSWETGAAKPRKYYTVTPKGAEVYAALKAQWTKIRDSLSAMMEEER